MRVGRLKKHFIYEIEESEEDIPFINNKKSGLVKVIYNCKEYSLNTLSTENWTTSNLKFTRIK